MTGCNNFCAYCAVPYARGRERSRPVKDILAEVNKLITQGYKEIILLGQNVNSYQGEAENGRKIKFPTLLKQIDKIPGNYWLSFLSSHPKDLSDNLIKCFSSPTHLMPYLHMALQSGSDKIITAMNRRYTAAYFINLIDKARKINPHIAISTDIIVGFPGETKKDLTDTIKVMKKIKFDMAYISQYSPRPNTAAAKLDDNVSKTTKKEREKILTNILKKTALEHNKLLIDQQITVLVDNIDNNTTHEIFGHTNQFKRVKIKTSNKKIKPGDFVNVKVTKATSWHIEAKPT